MLRAMKNMEKKSIVSPCKKHLLTVKMAKWALRKEWP